MQRIFPAFTYSKGPRDNCWWDDTVERPTWPTFGGTRTVDVAIIGGGFTGISAAYHLARAGVHVAVVEAETPGWGASGRNGGFCCLGGAKLSQTAMQRRFGDAATETYLHSEVAAVELAKQLIDRHNIDVDAHSQGETQMAHSPGAMEALRRAADAAAAANVPVTLTEPQDLAAVGLNGDFFGALTTPVGFGLNPQKYLFGLAAAAAEAGAELFQNSPVTDLRPHMGQFTLRLPGGVLQAKQVILATNGYSSDDIPAWLRARYLPSQSSVLVTRPLQDQELAAQGWTSDQMAYDTRHLLHYFRLMPDRRFLFGMRGGLRASAKAEAQIRRQLLRHFHKLFPAWKEVEVTHRWSGLVSLGAGLVPFIGPVPDHPGLFAGLNYHGNGVAMGTYAGRILADLVRGTTPVLPYSSVVQTAPRFPLGAYRRAFLPLAYGYYALRDLSFATSSDKA